MDQLKFSNDAQKFLNPVAPPSTVGFADQITYAGGTQSRPLQERTEWSTLVKDNFNHQVDLLVGATYHLPWSSGLGEDENFNVWEHKNDVEPQHWGNVQGAVSEDHFNFLHNFSKEEEIRINNYQNSTWATALLAAPADMTAMVPGILAFKAPTFLAAVGNAAISNFAVSAGEESLRHLSGVNATIEGSVLNMTAATVLGGSIGGSINLSKKAYFNFWVDAKRNNRHNQARIDIVEALQTIQLEAPAVAQSNRSYNALSDLDVNTNIISLTKRIAGLEKGIRTGTESLRTGVDAKGRRLSAARITNIENDIRNMESGIIKAATDKKKLAEEGATRLVERSTYETVDGTQVDIYRLKSTAWNPLPSPFQSLMNLRPIKDKATGKYKMGGLSMLKHSMMQISGDGGRLNVGNLSGLVNPQSVYTLSNVEKRHWKQVNTVAHETFAEHTNATKTNLYNMNYTSMYRRVSGSGVTFEQFTREAMRKRLNKENGSTIYEDKLIKEYDRFYESWGQRIDQTDLSGNRARVEQEIAFLDLDMDRINQRLSMPTSGPDKLPQRTRDWFEKRKKDNIEERALYDSALDLINNTQNSGRNLKEPFFNRIWDVEKMKAKPAEIKGILKAHFAAEGSVPVYDTTKKLFVRKKVSAANIDQNVDNIYNQIVNDKDPLDPDMISGIQGSLRMAHRMIDIENSKVFNFIHTDPIMVMQNYTARVAPKYHFQKAFGGRTPEKVWNDIEDQLRLDGYSEKFINKARLNWVTNQRRVMSSVYDDPTAMSIKVANTLKEVTTLNYLSTSGLASLADFARIVMDNKHMDTLQVTLNMLTDKNTRKSMREFGDDYGEILDMFNGSIANRISDSLTNDVNSASMWNNIKQAGHIMNGLGPITQLFKQMEGQLRIHKLLTLAKDMTNGRATDFEIEYAARHGLTVAMLKEIATKAPIQQGKGGMLFANINEWTTNSNIRVSEETTEAFRAAANQGVLNTIVSATPNDRPLIADGILYIRTSTAKLLPWGGKLKEDPTMKGYIKLESGYMTLPFQFYSFMFASMNKVTAAYTSGAVLNRVSGVIAAMGMGYISAYAKVPNYIWDKLDERDRMMRAFDYSGLASLYSTVIYDSMQQQVAMGQEPFVTKLTGLQPKFKPSAKSIDNQVLPQWMDAVTGVTGAGTSTIQDSFEALGHFGIPMLGDDTEYKKGFQAMWNILPLTGTIPVTAMTGQLGEAFGYKKY